MTTSNRRKRALSTIGATSLLFLVGCGSDDEDSSSTDATTDTETPAGTASAGTASAGTAPAGTAASAEAGDPCATWIAADGAVIGFLFAGQGDADSVNAALDAAIASAPEDNVDTLTALKEEAAPQLADPESEPSEETFRLYSDAIAWAGASCDDVETIDVVATDYHYEGIPEESSTGYKVVNFSNDGQEAHEIFTFRINDGVTETVEELMALPEDEAFTKITPVNAGFAMPGSSAVVSWNLAEPGAYAAICFVPVGSVGETEGTGAPHFTEGMIHEFTVT